MKRYLTVVLLLVLIPSALGKAVTPDRHALKRLKKFYEFPCPEETCGATARYRGRPDASGLDPVQTSEE